MRTWLVTGSACGLGRDLVEALLGRGEHVIATARDPAPLAELVARHPSLVRAIALDVTRPGDVQRAVAEAGAVDVLVNNAGATLLGAVEETSDEQARALFDTNFFGALDMTRAVLPGMRARRRGHVVNVSGISGFVGRAGLGVYAASKFAVEGLSEALAQELAPLGIHVTIVEPGAHRTGCFARAQRAAGELADYAATSGAMVERARSIEGRQPGDPARAAAAIIDAVSSERPPARLVVGRDALAWVRGKLDAVAEELDAWKSTTLSTGYPE